MNDIPAAKIKMMKGSIRCLIFGLLALVPAIGLPFGLAALWLSGQVRLNEKLYWNPAKPHRLCGMVCGAIGTILWAGIATIIIGQILLFNWLH